MDETGLQWKNMPERVFIKGEEKSSPGFKAFHDHFILLLGANLTGDCKPKPVMAYQAENPRALRGYEKNQLPVHWYVSSSGWMMGHHVFVAADGTRCHPDVQGTLPSEDVACP